MDSHCLSVGPVETDMRGEGTCLDELLNADDLKRKWGQRVIRKLLSNNPADHMSGLSEGWIKLFQEICQLLSIGVTDRLSKAEYYNAIMGTVSLLKICFQDKF